MKKIVSLIFPLLCISLVNAADNEQPESRIRKLDRFDAINHKIVSRKRRKIAETFDIFHDTSTEKPDEIIAVVLLAQQLRQ